MRGTLLLFLAAVSVLLAGCANVSICCWREEPRQPELAPARRRCEPRAARVSLLTEALVRRRPAEFSALLARRPRGARRACRRNLPPEADLRVNLPVLIQQPSPRSPSARGGLRAVLASRGPSP